MSDVDSVFAAVEVNYGKPQNYDASDLAFSAFVEIVPNKYPEVVLISCKNARISSNSVVFKYFHIYGESCIRGVKGHVYETYKKGYKFYLKYIFPKLNFSKKRLLVITDEWTSNYYHWHIFALRKLLYAHKKGLLQDSLIFLPKAYLNYKFVMPSLKRFGVKEEQIVTLAKKSNIKAAEVGFFPWANHANPKVYSEIRKFLIEGLESNLSFGDKIYISRQRMPIRNVENEEEVMQMLSGYGFKKVVMEDLSYDEQISVCLNAKYIIGPHGAGLANILFTKEDASLLELSTVSQVTDYFRFCNFLQRKYYFQLCQMGSSSLRKDFLMANLVVDLAVLEKNVKEMVR